MIALTDQQISLLATLYTADTPPSKHGQLCPISRRRNDRVKPPATACDCWIRHNALKKITKVIALINKEIQMQENVTGSELENWDDLCARKAYEAYSEKAGNRSMVTGHTPPSWDEQAEPIKDAWRAAAQAVATLTAERNEP